ncbi:MAG: hypothetical protein JSS57_21055 [Proteobacteria bacterium]|nr:hypothetical protein [Pseudomonadota bacterium]
MAQFVLSKGGLIGEAQLQRAFQEVQKVGIVTFADGFGQFRQKPPHPIVADAGEPEIIRHHTTNTPRAASHAFEA